MNEMNKRSISIYSAIIVLSVALIIGVAASIMFIYQNRYEKSLHAMTDKIVLKAADNVKENISASLGSAVRTSSVLNVMFNEHSGIEANKSEFSRMLTTMIGEKSNIYSLYYGDEEGNFFLVGKRKDESGNMRFFTKKIIHVKGKRISLESWLDDSGKVVSTKDITEFDKYVPKIRPWYVSAVAKGKPSWSAPYIFFITGEPGITYAVPTYVDGKIRGVCGVDLEIKGISFTKLSSLTSNTKFFLLDDMNKILAHSDMDKYLPQKIESKILDVDEIDDNVLKRMAKNYNMSNSNVESRDYYIDGKRYKTVTREANIEGLNLIIGIYTPYSDYLSVIFRANRQILILSIVVIIISVFVSIRISAAITRPFKILSVATDSISSLNFNNQIEIESRFPEARTLVRSFNKMIISLEDYKLQTDKLNKNLESAYLDTLYRLALAAEYKDHFTAEHLTRVSMISVFISDVLGMNKHEIDLMKHASAMHDVGKIGIPDDILIKPGKLTVEEFEVIKQHTTIGEKILKDPSSEIMEMARIVALSHHEKWNGLGYPYNLQGEDIPLYGRIVSVADVIDALVSKRSYKDAYSFEKTIEILTIEKGQQFQPELIELVLENRKHIETIIYNPM